jgi:hypothetical protein
LVNETVSRPVVAIRESPALVRGPIVQAVLVASPITPPLALPPVDVAVAPDAVPMERPSMPVPNTSIAPPPVSVDLDVFQVPVSTGSAGRVRRGADIWVYLILGALGILAAQFLGWVVAHLCPGLF